MCFRCLILLFALGFLVGSLLLLSFGPRTLHEVVYGASQDPISQGSISHDPTPSSHQEALQALCIQYHLFQQLCSKQPLHGCHHSIRIEALCLALNNGAYPSHIH